MASAAVGPTAVAQAPESPLTSRIQARLAEREGDLIALRRDLHRHPEVSGAEERTARVVAGRLRALGLEVRTGVGGHGVVGVLHGGRPGPVVAFRADMDAVPSSAPDPVEFRSLAPGVRHICGHDVHTTVGVAIAEALAPLRGELAGSVLLVFQPAEERVSGARAMLRDSVFGTRRPVAIYGVHTAPFPVGQLATMPGAMMAWRDQVSITLSGAGNLAAAADSVTRMIERVATVPASAATTPMAPGFIFAQVGPARPEGAGRVLTAMVSVATEASSERARAGIAAGLEGLQVPGVTAALEYVARAIPGVTNDSALTTAASGSIRAALGAGALLDLDVISPAFSEDFGAFQEQVPGTFFYLGVGPVGMPHSPGYVADEASIVVGARAMIAVILDRLGSAAGETR